NGTLSRDEVFVAYRSYPEELVDRMLELTGVRLSTGSRTALVTMCEASPHWERTDLLPLILMTPEFHLA
ncbi:MAG: hypothetical protein RLZZ01_2239, partial [Actinomycetota bacterium]